MSTRSQILTETFYQWEHRGRGYKEWKERVVLEPYFVPFWGHGCYLDAPHEDDGIIPSWLDRLAATFKKPTKQDALFTPSSILEYPEEVPEALRDVACDLAELEILFPSETSLQSDVITRLIPSLSHVVSPLSFEVVGTSQTLSILVSFPEAFEHQVNGYLKNTFPELDIRSSPDALQNAWLSIDSAYCELVEFGLDDEFLNPLCSCPKGAEPLARVFSILDNLQEHEIAVFQVLIAPAQAPWASSMVRVTQTPDGTPFFLNDEDLFHLVKEKVRTPLYSVVIRTAVRTLELNSCLDLTQELAQALHAIQAPGTNRLIPLESSLDDTIQQQVNLITRMTHRSGMILNEEEVLLLAHPPAGIQLDRLTVFDHSTQAAPLPQINGLTLGTNEHRGETNEVILPDTLRSRHMHLIGSTGSGKSNLLLHCIHEDIQRGQGVGVLDPHGDLIDRILQTIPEERIQDVILVDPSDEDHPLPFNILQAHSELEKTLLASDLTSIFRRFATSWGDQMTAVLDNAVLAILHHPRGGTLRDLQRFLLERPFRDQLLREVTDEQVRYYWEVEFPLLRGQPQASILTRLSMFLRPRSIRNMLLQPENALDFESIMDSRKILLVKLSHGLIGESNAHLLGALLVSKINQAVMARQAKSEAQRTPFWLYIDEFHHFACQSMSTILSGARKYQLGLILAHQDMKQVESRDPELAESVLSNAYARICFRLGDRDARTLERGFSHFEASDLQSLPIGHALCRFGQSDQDFNLQTEKFSSEAQGDRAPTSSIIEFCRQEYATPRMEVEHLLSKTLPRERPAKEAKRKTKETPPPAPDPIPVKRPEPSLPPPEPTVPVVPTPQTESKSESPQKTSSPKHSKPIEASQGLGGDEHRRLQARLKKVAEGFGYRATIEKQLSDGKLVDVALEKGEKRIAIEVSVTTPPAKEVQNIRKSLKAGYDIVIMTSPNPKVLSSVRRKAKATLDESQLSQVVFLSPDDISSHFVDLEAQSASGVEEIMGWEVETVYTSSEKLGAERQASQEASIGKLAKQMARKSTHRKKKS